MHLKAMVAAWLDPKHDALSWKLARMFILERNLKQGKTAAIPSPASLSCFASDALSEEVRVGYGPHLEGDKK